MDDFALYGDIYGTLLVDATTPAIMSTRSQDHPAPGCSSDDCDVDWSRNLTSPVGDAVCHSTTAVSARWHR
ncbi:Transposase [Streptomyces venezuelae]|nr:Transposase [Streptomyces venezuelae]